MGLLPLLAVAFIVLKLCGVIAWSWLWVLAPIWIPIACAVAFFCFMGLISLVAYLCSG